MGVASGLRVGLTHYVLKDIFLAAIDTVYVLLPQTVLLDAADADAIGADWADADAGSAGGKPLSEADAAKRRHVTLMDWGSQPVVEITVRLLSSLLSVHQTS